MQTVAETPEYMRRAEKLPADEKRRDVLNYLAAHPKAGDLMEGTGGVRKLRWSRGSRGKSGGVRVIYYFHDEARPASARSGAGLAQCDREKPRCRAQRPSRVVQDGRPGNGGLFTTPAVLQQILRNPGPKVIRRTATDQVGVSWHEWNTLHV